MLYSCTVSVLLSEAPTAAFTTLLTQCTPYLHPIPTVLSTTFTVHSPAHPSEVPASTSISTRDSTRKLSSAPSLRRLLHALLAVQNLRYQQREPALTSARAAAVCPRLVPWLLGRRLSAFIRDQLEPTTPTLGCPLIRSLPCAPKPGCLRLRRTS